MSATKKLNTTANPWSFFIFPITLSTRKMTNGSARWPKYQAKNQQPLP
jgi:hypothetical protein